MSEQIHRIASIVALLSMQSVLASCHQRQRTARDNVVTRMRDAPVDARSPDSGVPSRFVLGPYTKCLDRQPIRTQMRTPRIQLYSGWEPAEGCAELRRFAREEARAGVQPDMVDGYLLECNIASQFGGMIDLWLELSHKCPAISNCHGRIAERYQEFRQCMFSSLPDITTVPTHWQVEWETDRAGRLQHIVLFRTREAVDEELPHDMSTEIVVPACLRSIVQQLSLCQAVSAQTFRIRRVAGG